MRAKLTFITGWSLGLMVCGLYGVITQSDAFLGQRVFFTIVGILGWIIGNKLIELEGRLAELEKKPMAERAGASTVAVLAAR